MIGVRVVLDWSEEGNSLYFLREGELARARPDNLYDQPSLGNTCKERVNYLSPELIWIFFVTLGNGLGDQLVDTTPGGPNLAWLPRVVLDAVLAC